MTKNPKASIFRNWGFFFGIRSDFAGKEFLFSVTQNPSPHEIELNENVSH